MIQVSIKVTCDKCLNHKSVDFQYDDSIDLTRIDRIARDKLTIHGWIVQRMVNGRKITLCQKCTCR